MLLSFHTCSVSLRLSLAFQAVLCLFFLLCEDAILSKRHHWRHLINGMFQELGKGGICNSLIDSWFWMSPSSSVPPLFPTALWLSASVPQLTVPLSLLQRLLWNCHLLSCVPADSGRASAHRAGVEPFLRRQRESHLLWHTCGFCASFLCWEQKGILPVMFTMRTSSALNYKFLEVGRPSLLLLYWTVCCLGFQTHPL